MPEPCQPAPYQVENFVVEIRSRTTGEWHTFVHGGAEEEEAREIFSSALKSRGHLRGVSRYRLVRRVAVITGEVIQEDG